MTCLGLMRCLSRVVLLHLGRVLSVGRTALRTLAVVRTNLGRLGQWVPSLLRIPRAQSTSFLTDGKERRCLWCFTCCESH